MKGQQLVAGVDAGRSLLTAAIAGSPGRRRRAPEHRPHPRRSTSLASITSTHEVRFVRVTVAAVRFMARLSARACCRVGADLGVSTKASLRMRQDDGFPRCDAGWSASPAESRCSKFLADFHEALSRCRLAHVGTPNEGSKATAEGPQLRLQRIVGGLNALDYSVRLRLLSGIRGSGGFLLGSTAARATAFCVGGRSTALPRR